MVDKTISLELIGVVPSKKNAWKRGGNHVYLDKDIREELDDLIIQAVSQGRRYGPIIGKFVALFVFHTSDSKDLDNKTTTLLDVLQSAGIIENDKHNVGHMALKVLQKKGTTDFTEVVIATHNEA